MLFTLPFHAILFLWWLINFNSFRLCKASEVNERCLRTPNHLIKPVVSTVPLENMCKPWSRKACCTAKTAHKAHLNINHLNFELEHCGKKSNISEQCRLMFAREMCYYSCDPYIEPWVIKPERSFPQERLMSVPMCNHECLQWWNACKDAFTCQRNWRKFFPIKEVENEENQNSKISINFCPPQTECQPIRNIYSDHIDFCETIWDSAWKVVPDNDKCVKLSFDPTNGNPNKKVAQFYKNNKGRNLQEEIPPTWFMAFLFAAFIGIVMIIVKIIRYFLNCIFCCDS